MGDRESESAISNVIKLPMPTIMYSFDDSTISLQVVHFLVYLHMKFRLSVLSGWRRTEKKKHIYHDHSGYMLIVEHDGERNCHTCIKMEQVELFVYWFSDLKLSSTSWRVGEFVKRSEREWKGNVDIRESFFCWVNNLTSSHPPTLSPLLICGIEQRASRESKSEKLSPPQHKTPQELRQEKKVNKILRPNSSNNSNVRDFFIVSIINLLPFERSRRRCSRSDV